MSWRQAVAGLLAMTAIALTVELSDAQPTQADSIRSNEWHLSLLDVAAAQQISTGRGITVALLDSGVDASHHDLVGNVLQGTNLLDKNESTDDFDGHGTAMAGLIAAHGKGGDGVLGIAPDAKVLPVVVGNSPSLGVPGTYQNGGFAWAASHGARVISASFSSDNTPEMRADIQVAIDADVVIVAAAGNVPANDAVAFPAGLPGVVAVGGISQNETHDPSSVADNRVLITAPSVRIESTYKHGSYATSNGTSDATAIVAGVAALVRAKYPTISAAEVIHRLTVTATDKGPPGRDPDYGYGVVNPVAALTADIPPLSTSSQSAHPDTETPQAKSRSGLSAGAVASLGAALLALAAVGLSIVVLRRRNTGAK